MTTEPGLQGTGHGRFKLPMGAWEPSEEWLNDKNLRLRLTDSATGDIVVANVWLGDWQYGREFWAMPDSVDDEHLWYLQRLEPRQSRAYGGTIAALKWLGDKADSGGIWMTTEVLTHSEEHNIVVMAVLMTYGGYQSLGGRYARAMVRPPNGAAWTPPADPA